MSIINNIKEIFNELSNLFKNLFNIIIISLNYISPIINKFFIKLVDTFFNGDRFKMYISIFFIIFLLFYYYIIYVYKLFNLQENKFSYILSITVLGISLTTYFLLIHRNQYKKDYSIDFYNKESNKLYRIEQDSKTNKNEYKFDMKNLKTTLFMPILKSIKYFFMYILLFLIPFIVLIFIFYLLQNFKNSFTILQFILGLTIFLTTLAIIAKLFNVDNKSSDLCLELISNKEKDEDGFLNNFFNKIKILICLIKNFIFFVPCLLILFIDKLKEDIKLTHSTIFILLILEILLVTMVFLIPMFYKFLIQLNGNNLLGGQGPFYLNEYKVIGTYQELYGEKNDNTKNDPSIYNFNLPFTNEKYNLKTIFNGGPYKTKLGDYSYSISFYLYLNPQPENTSIAYNKETTLFNYSDKPRILYNGKTKQLIIRSKTNKSENDQSDTIFISDSNKYNNYNLKYQKWLFFIINYDKNVIDIFIDGKLVASKQNIPDFYNNEKISIGDPDNKINKDGIHGGIKDIYYFSQPQQPNNIEFLYNLTKNN
tara:strand:- start:775 stop:2388 length:1614 start_codon:yes stop_codon:yes gene_type:complete